MLRVRFGDSVVRFKGGDLVVFVRGVEEVDFFVKEGILFEVVLGIIIVFVVGSCVGILIMYCDYVVVVVFVIGYE